jgi:hypothetical protein
MLRTYSGVAYRFVAVCAQEWDHAEPVRDELVREVAGVGLDLDEVNS